MELGDNREINDLRLELESKKYYNKTLRMQMIIYIVDRISLNTGGLTYLSNNHEHIRLLAIQLVDADSNELIEMFNKIVT